MVLKVVCGVDSVGFCNEFLLGASNNDGAVENGINIKKGKVVLGTRMKMLACKLNIFVVVFV